MTEMALKRLAFVATKSSSFRSIWSVIIIIPLLILVLDSPRVIEILRFAAGALTTTLPVIGIAVLLIAYHKATGAETLVAEAFKGREVRMIILAALVGGLAPFCSCEVIPFIAGLLAVGVPLSAVMAFWLSSPLIDPPALLITASALGWDYAIGKTIAAVALGLIGGFGIWILSRQGAFSQPLKDRSTSGCSSCNSDPFGGNTLWRFWTEPDRRRVFRQECLANGLFLVKWLTLAYLLEALLVTYIPAQVIGAIVGGDGFFSIVMGAIVGAPAYLSGYAAPALVAGLIEQGMSAGAAMAFLVAGAVSSIPAMTAVWSLVKGRVFAAYLGFGISGAILSGLLFQYFV